LNLDFSKITIFFAVFLFSLSFHEAAHAWTAEKFGDSTGRYLGRITLNPLAHIDIFGTIIFPLVGLITGGMMFGWAKPVPVNTSAMRDRRLGDICTSAAGPLSNLLLAIVFFVLLKLIHRTSLLPIENLGQIGDALEQMFETGLVLNIVLFIFNLLPIPPLDGSHVLENLLPPGPAQIYEKIRPYGFILMIFLLMSGVLGRVITPVLGFVSSML